MKNLITAIALSCATFTSVQGTAAESWYTNGFGGVNIIDESTENPGLELENGYIAGFSAGRNLGEHFRIEGEVAYRENKGSVVEASALWKEYGEQTGKQQQVTAMANGILEILPENFVNPYVGVGAGGNFTRFSIPATDEEGSADFKSTTNGYAAQEIAGLRLNPLEKAEFGIEYRATHDLQFENKNRALSFNCGFKF